MTEFTEEQRVAATFALARSIHGNSADHEDWDYYRKHVDIALDAAAGLLVEGESTQEALDEVLKSSPSNLMALQLEEVTKERDRYKEAHETVLRHNSELHDEIADLLTHVTCVADQRARGRRRNAAADAPPPAPSADREKMAHALWDFPDNVISLDELNRKADADELDYPETREFLYRQVDAALALAAPPPVDEANLAQVIQNAEDGDLCKNGWSRKPAPGQRRAAQAVCEYLEQR